MRPSDEHRAELPFFFLSGFVTALVAARLAIVLGHFEGAGLRNLYGLGLGMLLATGGGAHFVFHRRARVALCAAFGAALGSSRTSCCRSTSSSST